MGVAFVKILPRGSKRRVGHYVFGWFIDDDISDIFTMRIVSITKNREKMKLEHIKGPAPKSFSFAIKDASMKLVLPNTGAFFSINEFYDTTFEAEDELMKSLHRLHGTMFTRIDKIKTQIYDLEARRSNRKSLK